MKKGITATSVAIMVVVIIILLGTITTISYNSIQNAKKIVFSLEISNIQEEVDRYVKDSIDSSYPTLGNSYTINLSNVSENAISQFDGEEKSANNEISVLEVDLTILGIADTTYGNKKTSSDVYVLSEKTGRVYYLAGIKSKNTTYYTLTDDLIKLKDKKSKTDTEKSSLKPVISTDGFITKTLSDGTKEIYLSNISASNSPKVFKYEVSIIPEAKAKTYFATYGKTITSDRLSVSEGKDITLYAENEKGEYDIEYYAYRAPIPAGFYYVGGEVATGMVISDNAQDENKGYDTTGNVVSTGLLGNQFVWVPVEDITKFKRTTTYNGTITDPGTDHVEPFGGTVYEEENRITLSLTNDLTGEWAEYTAMVESVKKFGGFYIGRYETGKVDTSIVVKKEQTVYSNLPWGKNMVDVGTDSAVTLSRSMYNSSASVVSTLIYGVQWDAALNFISKIDSTYATNSYGKGWYNSAEYNYTTTNPSHLTGKDIIENGKIANAPCNIYDMAGNMLEWTMESIYTGVNAALRIVRGGSYAGYGKDMPAAYRSNKIASGTMDRWGFRIALYLK